MSMRDAIDVMLISVAAIVFVLAVTLYPAYRRTHEVTIGKRDHDCRSVVR